MSPLQIWQGKKRQVHDCRSKTRSRHWTGNQNRRKSRLREPYKNLCWERGKLDSLPASPLPIPPGTGTRPSDMGRTGQGSPAYSASGAGQYLHPHLSTKGEAFSSHWEYSLVWQQAPDGKNVSSLCWLSLANLSWRLGQAPWAHLHSGAGQKVLDQPQVGTPTFIFSLSPSSLSAWLLSPWCVPDHCSWHPRWLGNCQGASRGGKWKIKVQFIFQI